jgi:hypothetical protein
MVHIHYYLNVDRCAYYWTDGAAGNNIGDRKYIGQDQEFYLPSKIAQLLMR